MVSKILYRNTLKEAWLVSESAGNEKVIFFIMRAIHPEMQASEPRNIVRGEEGEGAIMPEDFSLHLHGQREISYLPVLLGLAACHTSYGAIYLKLEGPPRWYSHIWVR